MEIPDREEVAMSLLLVLSLFAVAYGIGSGLGEVGEGLKEVARAIRAGRI